MDADQNKLNNAPRYTDNQKQNPGDIKYANQVYTHFNQSMWWSGGDQGGKGFGNAQRLSDLLKSTVKDSSGKELGSVNNLALNMSGGRVIYVILRPTGEAGQNNALYALPPMALTKGSDQNTLTTGIDQNKLSSAPKFQSDNWQQIQNAGYAMNVYRYYGKEPYWGGENLAPTGRDDSQKPFEQQNQDQNNQNWNQDNQNNQNQNSGNPNEGGAGEPTGKSSGFGDAKGIRNLTQRNVQSQSGENLGKLEEVVVDLESGRVLYAMLSSGGQNYAVPPQLFGQSRGVNDPLRLNTSKQNLTRAPKAPTGSDIGSMNFVNQLYRHYGQQTWWGGGPTPTGRDEGQFSNARLAMNLLHRNVMDSSGQQLGKVDNVLIDLHDARVTFLLLNAPGVAKAGQVFAVPPMAFTKASDNNNLVTGVDKNKLQSAPQVQSHNFNQLNDATFAANVYQFYGKEPVLARIADVLAAFEQGLS